MTGEGGARISRSSKGDGGVGEAAGSVGAREEAIVAPPPATKGVGGRMGDGGKRVAPSETITAASSSEGCRTGGEGSTGEGMLSVLVVAEYGRVSPSFLLLTLLDSRSGNGGGFAGILFFFCFF